MIKPPLRPWQIAALNEWREAGRHGIVAAATGTGKTRVAIEVLSETPANWVRVVVVPTTSLQHQWVDVITRQLGIHPREVGTLGGERPSYELGQRLLVAVLNSARDRLPPLVDHWRQSGLSTLLIVDECHRAGAPETAKALWSTHYDATLGLSATPERGDDGLDDFLIPALGPVVYRYALRDALDQGVLSKLTAANLYLDLGQLEMAEYRSVEQRIQQLMAEGAGQSDPRVKRLRADQQAVTRKAAGRHIALAALLGAGLLDERRSLVFHETIEQAEITGALLDVHGCRYAVEHSRLSPQARATALRRFAAGSVDVLATVRALDEGIDVPAANTAVIVSGTMNPRQRLQRAGRIVRPAGGGSLLISLLARGTTEELEVGAKDAALFGSSRINHIAAWDHANAKPVVAFLRSLAAD